MDKYLNKLISTIAGFLIIRFLFDLIYIYYLTDKWAYIGFILDINVYKVVISYLFVCILGFFSSFYNKSFSNLFLVVLINTFYIPFSLFYGLGNTPTFFFLFVSLMFIIITSVVISFRKQNYNYFNDNENFIHLSFMSILLLFTLYTLVVMTLLNIKNINFSVLTDLTQVYEMRKNVNYSFGMNYFFSWQSKVITPFLIAISLKNKKYLFSLALILSQFWLYIITGHKMVLFNTIIVLLIIVFSNTYKNRNVIQYFLVIVVFSQMISLFEIYIFKNSWLVDNFLRRVFYVPAYLSNLYHDYFNTSNFRYWKDSLLGRIFQSDSIIELPSFTVGRIYFNNPSTNAVTGFVGSEYANAGYIGIALGTLILIAVLLLIDFFSRKVNSDIVLITFLSPIYTLWNSAILTSLLTGGIIIAIILMMMTKKYEKVESLYEY